MLKFKTKAIFVLCFAKFTTVNSQTLHCDPLDNVSYHKQLAECIKCETCPLGYGKVTLEVSYFHLSNVRYIISQVVS